VVVGVITVACGFYYYLKVVRAMYWESPAGDTVFPLNGLSRLTISAMIAGIIFLGVYPQPILNALHRRVRLFPPRPWPGIDRRD